MLFRSSVARAVELEGWSGPDLSGPARDRAPPEERDGPVRQHHRHRVAAHHLADALMTPFSATVTEDAFRVPARPGRRIRIIRLLPGKVLTEQTIEEPTERDGAVVSDPARDVLKMVVVEKNRGSGEIAVGFVRGLGLEFGAIASSVAHDAHNFMAIGADDGSIATALNCLIRNGGGLAASKIGRASCRERV